MTPWEFNFEWGEYQERREKEEKARDENAREEVRLEKERQYWEGKVEENAAREQRLRENHAAKIRLQQQQEQERVARGHSARTWNYIAFGQAMTPVYNDYDADKVCETAKRKARHAEQDNCEFAHNVWWTRIAGPDKCERCDREVLDFTFFCPDCRATACHDCLCEMR